MLLYLVKHSRPDIANAVRELSKVLDCSTNGAYKEMLRCIKYVLDTKSLGLKIWPKGNKSKPWEIICFTDSDYPLILKRVGVSQAISFMYMESQFAGNRKPRDV